MKLCLSVSLSLLALACGGSTEGEEGKILYTPLDCGRTSCTFDDPLAVGGRLSLHIAGEEGTSTIGVDVRSTDSSKLTVEGVPDVGGRATWELTALADGEVGLEAFRPADGDDAEEIVDTLTIALASVSRLGLQNFIGDAVGPGDGGGDFDESWSVNADAPVSFRVTPFDSADTVAMGLFDYTVTLDAELENGLIDGSVSEGRLYFRAPVGSWSAEWMGAGITFTAQIVAE